MYSTAQAMKKDIAELNAVIKANPKGAHEALAAQKRGAYAQQLELAKAYLFFYFSSSLSSNCRRREKK